MSKPLAGKRYFHALGNRFAHVKGLSHAINAAGLRDCPLWAQNAFVDGWWGIELRRRPAWTERRDQPDYTLAA